MFSIRLKELRSKKNLTQHEFAKELGVNKCTLVDYESQRKEPSFDELICIADYFKVSTDYLLGRDEASKNSKFFISKDLHKNQIHILEFVISFKSSFGYSPSIREICKGVGLSSTSTVYCHLNKLETLGYLRRNPDMPRSIAVLNVDYSCEK